ncbi:unnamed protein product [Brassica napus]|uniref:(rape) hypothetical protein n=1 Tax=Brassica napus TaxID=3708 RepID=A0A816KDQ3_BRANA|nr:unnamed protein product [Brassica napus]
MVWTLTKLKSRLDDFLKSRSTRQFENDFILIRFVIDKAPPTLILRNFVSDLG